MDNPHDVPAEYDLVLTPPAGAAEAWSQNIQFSASFGEPGGGIWVHAGSIGTASPPLWEMVLAVLLPGGDVLSARTFGRPADPAQASSGPHTLVVEQPLRRWSMCFDGVARRVVPAATATAPVAEGPVEPLVVELAFEAHSPIWSLERAGGRMDAQDWAHLHTEQAIRVRGTVRGADGELRFDRLGIRDVSVGSRNFDRLEGHTWASCALPDGRFFGAYHVRSSGDVPHIEHGLYWDGATLHDLGGISTEPLTSPTGAPERSVIRFDGPDGPITVTATINNHMTYTLTSEGRIIPGADFEHCDLFLVEAPATFDWNGERGHGWVERTARAGTLGLR